jgi:hypothetical protein
LVQHHIVGRFRFHRCNSVKHRLLFSLPRACLRGHMLVAT